MPYSTLSAIKCQMLVAIDSRVDDYQHLLNGLVPDAEAIVLDPNRDGVAQISEALQRYPDLTSLHIVSHGSPGSVQLGSTRLCSETLDRYATQLRGWSAANSILIYGCRVAAGEVGLAFVEKLEQLTGANIAASSSLTGDADLGGDWEFEIRSKQYSVPLAFKEHSRESYFATLTTFNVNDPDDEDGSTPNALLSLRESILAANQDAMVGDAPAGTGTDEIILPAGTFTFSITGENEDAAATGDLDITDDLIIRGAGSGSTIVDAAMLDRVFHVLPGISLTLEDLTIQNGLADSGMGTFGDFAGGILVENNLPIPPGPDDPATVNLNNVVVRDNEAADSAGGILNIGNLIVNNSSISNNTSSGGSGGSGGGGIFNNSNSTTAEINDSTIANNTAAEGGGIFNASNITLQNSTISGNIADGRGGGIFNDGGGTSTLDSATIYNNEAEFSGIPSTGGGGINNFSGTVKVGNTIIAGNRDLGGKPDVSGTGTITSNDHNLVENDPDNNFTAGNDITGMSPMLAALADNGGPTQTHALMSGSPAIDAGDTTLATDQRGTMRDANPDIGAYELSESIFDFDQPTYTVTEGSGGGFTTMVTVRVNRSGDTAGEDEVEVQLGAGTAPSATAGDDYDDTPLTLDFGDGDTFAETMVPIAADNIPELDENIALSLVVDPSAGMVGTTNPNATLTIEDDEPPVYDFDAPSFSEFEGDVGDMPTVTVTVNRMGNTNNASTVDVVLTDGTATTADNDYNPTPVGGATVNFAATETSKTVDIELIGDNDDEGDESFNLSFDNFMVGGMAEGMAGTTNPNATVTILNDDGPPIYDFEAASYSEFEGTTVNPTVDVTVLRSGNITEASEVDVVLTDGTATTANNDYDSPPTPTPVTFAAGETSKTVSIEIIGDTATEPDETVNLSFGNFMVGGMMVGQAGTTNPNASLTIRNDDGPPTYNFNSGSFSAPEGDQTNTTLAVTVARSGNVGVTSTVDVILTNGTANAGSDFNSNPVTVEFKKGETLKNVPIQIFGDTEFEPDETINLSLSGGMTGTGNPTATLTITNDDNTAPVAEDDIATTPANEQLNISVLSNDNDPDGDPLSITTVDSPTENGGVVAVNTNGTVTYVPRDGFTGEDTFEYTITDGKGETDTATVTVTVEPIPSPPNLAPSANDDTITTTAGMTVVANPLINDGDPNGDAIFLESFDTTSESSGTITRNESGTPGDFSDDTLEYTPREEFIGIDRFSYTISDGNGETATGTITVEVQPPNTPPDAVDDNINAFENEVTTIDVLENDVDEDNDPLTIDSFDTTTESGGTVALNDNETPDDPSDDTLEYTPPEDFIGDDRFTYTISDDRGDSDTATVNLSVSEPGSQDCSIRIPVPEMPEPDQTLDTINGSVGQDTFDADPNPNTIFGKSGDDIFAALEGNDFLDGEEGDDLLFGNQGSDLIDGGEGNDTIYGGQNNDFIEGNAGEDVLVGDLNDDILVGGADNDFLFGNQGEDILDGGEGVDTLFGGQQDDALKGRAGDDIVVGDMGNDSVQGGNDNDQLFGNSGFDVLDGCQGDDSMFGGANSDTMYGSTGNDTLSGDLGDDSMFGGENDDFLDGGAGNDTLTGGSGSDRFLISQNQGQDTITDFTREDQFVLAPGLELEDVSVAEVDDSTVLVLFRTSEIITFLPNTPPGDISPSRFVPMMTEMEMDAEMEMP